MFFFGFVEERTYISVCGRGGCAGGKDGKEQQSHRLHVQLHGDDAVHHLTSPDLFAVFVHHSPITRHRLRTEELSPEVTRNVLVSHLLRFTSPDISAG